MLGTSKLMRNLWSVFWLQEFVLLPGAYMTKRPQVFRQLLQLCSQRTLFPTSCTLLTGWFQSICSKVETFISLHPFCSPPESPLKICLSARWCRNEAVGASSQKVHTVVQLSWVTGPSVKTMCRLCVLSAPLPEMRPQEDISRATEHRHFPSGSVQRSFNIGGLKLGTEEVFSPGSSWKHPLPAIPKLAWADKHLKNLVSFLYFLSSSLHLPRHSSCLLLWN